jgi:hypothetical protein
MPTSRTSVELADVETDGEVPVIASPVLRGRHLLWGCASTSWPLPSHDLAPAADVFCSGSPGPAWDLHLAPPSPLAVPVPRAELGAELGVGGLDALCDDSYHLHTSSLSTLDVLAAAPAPSPEPHVPEHLAPPSPTNSFVSAASAPGAPSARNRRLGLILQARAGHWDEERFGTSAGTLRAPAPAPACDLRAAFEGVGGVCADSPAQPQEPTYDFNSGALTTTTTAHTEPNVELDHI